METLFPMNEDGSQKQKLHSYSRKILSLKPLTISLAPLLICKILQKKVEKIINNIQKNSFLSEHQIC
ncbi:hypothetical protein RchiOBHm_Chr3g0451181 [Rosa chinensis]|uniref:Uncharacterized protein n=1 Tax=Rosa chinensis TaxID=74649 RepID=A0A2P6R601_ROSCH|nr:hypothetical protein RchiOBHm_Chr3g0451181 [Rosa chinensis]